MINVALVFSGQTGLGPDPARPLADISEHYRYHAGVRLDDPEELVRAVRRSVRRELLPEESLVYYWRGH